MKAHLLNWTFGPAFLGAVFASAGADPAADPTLDPGVVGPLAVFFGAWYLVVLVLRIVAQRLNEGRLAWTEVRLLATAMAIQLALLLVTLAALLAVRELAIVVTGGWPRGWRMAPGGAAAGAVVGLLLGLGVARLRLPQRLGLDRATAPDRREA